MYKVALIASAIVLVGCTGKVAPSGAALAITQWVLSGFESTIGINSPPNRYITLGLMPTINSMAWWVVMPYKVNTQIKII